MPSIPIILCTCITSKELCKRLKKGQGTGTEGSRTNPSIQRGPSKDVKLKTGWVAPSSLGEMLHIPTQCVENKGGGRNFTRAGENALCAHHRQSGTDSKVQAVVHSQRMTRSLPTPIPELQPLLQGPCVVHKAALCRAALRNSREHNAPFCKELVC